MKIGRAIAVVADREHHETFGVLTDLGWQAALELLRVVRIVVAVAYTQKRVQRREPLIIGVAHQDRLQDAIRLACSHLRGDCRWYMCIEGEPGRMAANAIQIDGVAGGSA